MNRTVAISSYSCRFYLYNFIPHCAKGRLGCPCHSLRYVLHAHTHTYIHTHAHTRTHARTQTHAHTHTHADAHDSMRMPNGPAGQVVMDHIALAVGFTACGIACHCLSLCLIPPLEPSLPSGKLGPDPIPGPPGLNGPQGQQGQQGPTGPRGSATGPQAVDKLDYIIISYRSCRGFHGASMRLSKVSGHL